MGTSAKLFRSSTGFISPYFIVDVEGNLMSKTVTVMGNRIELTANSYISYNGQPLLTATSLASTVTNIPGTLTSLTVNGPVNLTGNFSLTGGTSAVINPTTTGTLDNVTIGATTPKPGTFTTLTSNGIASVDMVPTGLMRINPTGPVLIGSSGTVTSVDLNTGAANFQLGGSRPSQSSFWTAATGRYTLQASGFPYHSYGATLNLPTVQNYNTNFILRAGTNVAGSNQLVTPGIIGYALNGVAIFAAATNDPPASYSIPLSGWNYNASYRSATVLGYNYYHDLAGGRTVSGQYIYTDYSFATAWTSGVGHTTGATATTGVADANFILYLGGSLTHSDGHSKILGYALDGYPIYGPFGYGTATNRYSPVRRMLTGYTLNTTRTGFNAQPVNSTYPLGIFTQDYSFTGGGDLDYRNGRYCVTPDYPNGTYAYFMTVDSSGNPAYPYCIGTNFYGNVGTAGSGGGVGPTTIAGGTVTVAPNGTLTLGTNGQTTNFVGNLTATTNQTITFSPTSGAVIINPGTTGSIDNVTIGGTTAVTGRFTNVTLTAANEQWNSNRSQASTKRYAELSATAIMYFSMNGLR